MFKLVTKVLFWTLLTIAGAHAAPITTETWYLGGFSSLGGPVTGGGSGGGAIDPGAPAWTFTIADDHVLSVIDCCAPGDSFDVFDGASLIGTTTVGVAGGCLTATSCDALVGVGRGDFLLGAGTYSITMTVATYFGQPGNLFFNVRDVADAAVPEPGTLLLAGAALAGLAGARRRRHGSQSSLRVRSDPVAA